MKSLYLFVLLSTLFLINSCIEEENETYIIKGKITDFHSNEPVENIEVWVDAVGPRNSSVFGYRRKIGEAVTDPNGYYSMALRVSDDASFLEFFINPHEKNNHINTGGIFSYHRFLEDFDKDWNFFLKPSARLKIWFKNVDPKNNSDIFWYSAYSGGRHGFFGKNEISKCGQVDPWIESDFSYWKGKDVCGSLTYTTLADELTYIRWTVETDNIKTQYNDSIMAKRNTINEYFIEY